MIRAPFKCVGFHRSARLFSSTRKVSGENGQKSESLVKILRGASADGPTVTPEFFTTMSSVVRQNAKSKALLSAYSDRLAAIAPSLSTDESLKVLQNLSMISSNVLTQDTHRILRNVAANLPKHGVSSFSLDSILAYAKICRKLRVNPDALFMKSLIQRVTGLNPQSPEDQLEYLKYVVSLDREWVNPSLLERILPLITEEVIGTDIAILSELESLCDLHDLEKDDELRKSIDSLTEGSIQTLPIEGLLEAAVDLPINSVIYDRVIGAIKPNLPKIMDEPSYASQLLLIASRRRPIPDFLVDIIDQLSMTALNDSPNSLQNIRSIAKLFRDSQVPERIAEKVVSLATESSDFSFELAEDIERFVRLVESVTVLRIKDPILIGVLARKINELHLSGRLLPSFWKLAAWWQITCHSLPFDSLIPDILRREYPEMTRALTECSVESLVQPSSGRSGIAVEAVSAKLKESRLPFTPFPRIGNTPVRAHVRVTLGNGSACFVIMTKNGSLMQISNHTITSVSMIEDCVSMVPAKLAVVPFEFLESANPFEVMDIIAKYVVE